MHQKGAFCNQLFSWGLNLKCCRLLCVAWTSTLNIILLEWCGLMKMKYHDKCNDQRFKCFTCSYIFIIIKYIIEAELIFGGHGMGMRCAIMDVFGALVVQSNCTFMSHILDQEYTKPILYFFFLFLWIHLIQFHVVQLWYYFSWEN